jgi:beta-mannosidase
LVRGVKYQQVFLLPEVFLKKNCRDLYVGDYLKLYVDTIYQAIGDVEGHNQRPFVDSSPSNGIISDNPYVKQWGSASTATAGDAHFYDYSSDCESYSMYPQSKFISEFGFQVHPSYLAYEPVTTPEDRSKNSKFVAYRQRHEDGNNQMEYQMTRHFKLPVQGCENDSEPLHGFDNYLYISQLQQSRCYETAINYWRSLRSDHNAQTMGILYWQLNDIWEGPSWASMEWGGRWKPLQYTVKRIFSEVALSFIGLPGDDKVSIYGVNDLPDDVQVTYSLYLVPWNLAGDLTDKMLVSTNKVNLSAGSSLDMSDLSINSLLSSDCTRNSCFLYLTGSGVNLKSSTSFTLPSTVYYLDLIKNLDFTVQPKIETSSFKQTSPNQITFDLEVDRVSPFLFIELKGDNDLVENPAGQGVNNVNAGWFNDNNFLALPGKKYSMTYTSFQPITVPVDEWTTKLQTRSIQTVQTESC